MTLYTTYSSLPQTQANQMTFARTERGEYVSLGMFPRLTIGERLLGKYKQFFQIGLGSRTQSRTFKTRSASGRLQFEIELDVSFFVPEDKAINVFTWDGDPVEKMMKTFEADAREESEFWEIRQYLELQWKLKDQFDPKNANPTNNPLSIERVSVSVSPPDEVTLPNEQVVNLKNLDLQIAEAESRGDKKTAANLREARNVLHEIRNDEAKGILLTADSAIKLRQRINAMMEEGFMKDDPVVQAIQAKLEAFTTSENVPRLMPEDDEKVEPPKPKLAKPRSNRGTPDETPKDDLD